MTRRGLRVGGVERRPETSEATAAGFSLWCAPADLHRFRGVIPFQIRMELQELSDRHVIEGPSRSFAALLQAGEVTSSRSRSAKH